MFKIIIFVFLFDCSENFVFVDSVVMMLLEEFVCLFLVWIESEGFGMLFVKLVFLNFDFLENEEKRWDLVFFVLKLSFSEFLVKENLMCFLFVVERDDDDEGICFWILIFL